MIRVFVVRCAQLRSASGISCSRGFFSISGGSPRSRCTSFKSSLASSYDLTFPPRSWRAAWTCWGNWGAGRARKMKKYPFFYIKDFSAL